MTGKHALKLWVLAAFGGMFSVSASALPFFEEDFDFGITDLEWDGNWRWEVTNGTVDIIQTGDGYGVTCVTGGCIDIDGTSLDSGELRVQTTESFTLEDDQTYQLSARISGSQRDNPTEFDNNAPNNVWFGFTDSAGAWLPGASNIIVGPLAYSDVGFTLYTLFYTPVAQIVGARLAFMSGPLDANDNVGAIVDNISLAAVPLPAAAWLLLSGLGAMGVVARRRRPAIAVA